MAAPSYVPSAVAAPTLYRSPPRRLGSWQAQRPGEVVGAPLDEGSGFGNQGPDQGYVLKLAQRFTGQLHLSAGEHENDALAGCAAVALRRASMFGRAPVMHDLRVALELFGFLGEANPELLAWRQQHFAGAAGHHGYHVKRHLADLVPAEMLRRTPEVAAAARAKDWRSALGL